MTKEFLTSKAHDLKKIIEISINEFKEATGYNPAIEIKTLEIAGFGDRPSKSFSEVLVKIEL